MAERGVDNIAGTSNNHVGKRKKSKPPPKTPAEKQRTYRLKKKKINAGSTYVLRDLLCLTALLSYTEGGSKLLGKEYHLLAFVLSGDFNVDLSKDDGLKLIQFLKSELNLDIVSDRAMGTTRYGTTIDAVFSRFVNDVSTNVYVSYFSYHKPLVTVIKNESNVDLINIEK